ncbi:MAG: flippase-like domain-containing protein [Candidatus Bathyarchaeia archaeon]
MIFGLVIFLLYLQFFIGFGDIFSAVQGVDVGEFFLFYFLSMGALLAVIGLWVLSWKSLLDSLSVRVSFRNAFMYYWIGYFVDLLVPLQSVGGEVMRLYLVRRKTREDYGSIAASGVANRMVAYGIVVTGLSMAMVYLLTVSTVPAFALNLLLLTWAGALVFLGILLYLAFAERAVEKLASAFVKTTHFLRLRRNRAGLSPKTLESLGFFQQGFKFLRANPRHIVKPFFLQMVAFVLNIAVYVFVFYALGFSRLPIDFFIVVYLLTGAIQDVAGVFSVGFLDILLTSIFMFYGIPPAESGVATAVLRSVVFWFPLTVGYLSARHVSVKGLAEVQPSETVPGKDGTPTAEKD